MSETNRSDIAHIDAGSGAERDAKVEQLLLVGLDHYFANRYELAINVWTRVLFLDRSHARARAYIERARSAQAERQRESEELLQNGVSAFERGEGGEARRLIEAAIEAGAPSEEAFAVLERLNRLETAAAPEATVRDRVRLTHAPKQATAVRRSVAGVAAAASAMAGTMVMAVAPLPITTTCLPLKSKFSGHCCGWIIFPLNLSMSGNSGR